MEKRIGTIFARNTNRDLVELMITQEFFETMETNNFGLPVIVPGGHKTILTLDSKPVMWKEPNKSLVFVETDEVVELVSINYFQWH
jgi:hypothetical protein